MHCANGGPFAFRDDDQLYESSTRPPPAGSISEDVGERGQNASPLGLVASCEPFEEHLERLTVDDDDRGITSMPA